MKGYEVGDPIHGYRIIAEARKISDPLNSQERQAQSPADSPDRERSSGNRQKRQMVRSGMRIIRLIGRTYLGLECDYLFYVRHLRLWNRPERHRGRLRQGLPLRRLRACLQGLRIQDYLPPLQFSQHQEGEVAFLGGFIKLQLPLLAII